MLSFNPAERVVIFTITSDIGLFELTTVLTQTAGEIKDLSAGEKKGSGQNAIRLII